MAKIDFLMKWPPWPSASATHRRMRPMMLVQHSSEKYIAIHMLRSVLIWCVRITYMLCNNYTTYQCCQVHVICCLTIFKIVRQHMTLLFKDYDTEIYCVRNLICCVKLDNIWIAMHFSDDPFRRHLTVFVDDTLNLCVSLCCMLANCFA